MDFIDVLLGVLLTLSSLFLIMIVLVQRGRGGGLTGALGGMGGQSAFGTKAGDVFTRITIGAAAVWILLCVITVKKVGGGADPLNVKSPPSGTIESSFDPSKTDAPAGAAVPESTGTEKTDAPAADAPAAKTEEAAPAEKKAE